jgi:sugar lactone lactonase YvrE
MTEHLTERQQIDYVYRALTDDQRAEIERHLADCTACRARLAEQQSVERRVHYGISAKRREAAVATDSSYAAIAPRVKQPSQVARTRERLTRVSASALAAVALAVFVIALISLFGGARQATVDVQPTPTPTITPTPSPTATPPAKLTWQIEGEVDPLSGPSGITLDEQGNLYVVDASNDRLVKYDPAGKRLSQWGGHGQGDGQFDFGGQQNPPGSGGVTVDQQGNIYVADTGNARVQKFDHDGKFLLKWGSQGEGEGQFGRLVGVVVDTQGNVYTAEDAPRSRIQKFDPNGKFLLQWATSPSTTGLPFSPDDIAIDSQDVIYLVDLGSGSIQRIDSHGQFVDNWPLTCGRQTVLMSPDSLAVDANGNVYVADHLANRICKYDHAGQFLAQWDVESIIGSPCGTMSGMIVDIQKNVYISDTPNNRVLKFSQP